MLKICITLLAPQFSTENKVNKQTNKQTNITLGFYCVYNTTINQTIFINTLGIISFKILFVNGTNNQF